MGQFRTLIGTTKVTLFKNTLNSSGYIAMAWLLRGVSNLLPGNKKKKYILPRDDPNERHIVDANHIRPGSRLTVGRTPAAHMKAQGYEVLPDEIIGEGFYGKVVRARMATAEVACKVQPANDTATEEVNALRNVINHQNIVQVFAIFEPLPLYRQEGKVYIFMELMRTNLKHFVQQREGLDEEEAKYWLKQIAAGLKYIHSLGWAHRDLKAENVLLDETLSVAKLTDFSISCRVIYTNGGRTRSESQASRLERLNPQWRERNPGDNEDPQLGDVFSLGETLFFMFEVRESCTVVMDAMADVQENTNVFFSPISQTAKDFVNLLMTPSDDERPTVVQVLEHPWLRSQIQEVSGAEFPMASAHFGPEASPQQVNRFRTDSFGSSWVHVHEQDQDSNLNP